MNEARCCQAATIHTRHCIVNTCSSMLCESTSVGIRADSSEGPQRDIGAPLWLRGRRGNTDPISTGFSWGCRLNEAQQLLKVKCRPLQLSALTNRGADVESTSSPWCKPPRRDAEAKEMLENGQKRCVCVLRRWKQHPQREWRESMGERNSAERPCLLVFSGYKIIAVLNCNLRS